MIGDTVIIEELDEVIGQKLTESFSPYLEKGVKKIITIGGPSGSKKTERALTLQKNLKKWGYLSKILSQDDLYRIGPGYRNTWREVKGVEFVGKEEIDWNLVDIICNDFRIDESVWMPRFDSNSEHYEWVNWPSENIEILIIEGIYSCFLQALTGIIPDFSIYLDVTPSQTLPYRQRRNKENEYSDFRQKVVEKEYLESLESREFCNVLVNFEGCIDISGIKF